MLAKPDFESFGGIAGRILRETLSLGTLFTGIALAATLGLMGWWLTQFKAYDATAPLMQVGLSFVLAKFALQGRNGEWKGSLLSVRGASLWGVIVVASRYLLLCTLWVAPLLLLGLRMSQVETAWGEFMFGQGGKKMLSLGAIYIAGLLLTPPVSLIAAVGADGIEDLISFRYWHTMFAGRVGDLFLIYAVCLGGFLMVFVLFIPFFIATMFQHMKAGFTFLGLALVFASGFQVTLLGKLCGFFAGLAPREEAVVPPAPGPVPLKPQSPASPPRLSTPARVVQSASGSDSLGRSGGDLGATPRRDPQVTSLPNPSGEPRIKNPSGRPPLLDARKQVDDALASVDLDPAGSLRRLEELNEAYAPHPLVMHALCLTRLKAGQKESALILARESLPLLFERGNVRLAAEVYREFMHHPELPAVRTDHLLAVAQAFLEIRDLSSAIETNTRVLAADSLNRPAIKMMLQIAESCLASNSVEESHRVYSTLVQRCPASPLAAYIQQGFQEAERRLQASRRTA